MPQFHKTLAQHYGRLPRDGPCTKLCIQLPVGRPGSTIAPCVRNAATEYVRPPNLGPCQKADQSGPTSILPALVRDVTIYFRIIAAHIIIIFGIRCRVGLYEISVNVRVLKVKRRGALPHHEEKGREDREDKQ